MDNMDKSWKAVVRMTVFLGGMLVSSAILQFSVANQLRSVAIVFIILWLIFFILWLASVIQWTILHKRDMKEMKK